MILFLLLTAASVSHFSSSWGAPIHLSVNRNRFSSTERDEVTAKEGDPSTGSTMFPKNPHVVSTRTIALSSEKEGSPEQMAKIPDKATAVPVECSTCKETKDCGAALNLVCYKDRCIKTGELKKTSISKCFPNLAECAMCTEDAQCRSGKCSYSRCVLPYHLQKSLKLCGVETGSSHDGHNTHPVPGHEHGHSFEPGNEHGTAIEHNPSHVHGNPFDYHHPPLDEGVIWHDPSHVHGHGIGYADEYGHGYGYGHSYYHDSNH